MLNIETFVAIDGEGIGRAPHRYTYLALVDEHGEAIADRSAHNLSTPACLDTILNTRLAFGFSTTYDLTMWLRDLSPRAIFTLARPDTRRNDRGIPRPLDWYPNQPIPALRANGARGYRLNYIRGRFEVEELAWIGERSVALDRKAVVWDLFRFFGTSFVAALTTWDVGTPEQREQIELMKGNRGDFKDDEREEIEAYCRDECVLLAQLARKLLTAHEDAGLPLTVFFGPGSTASVLLQKLNINRYSRKPWPEMLHAVSVGFVGGRFEISRLGPIRQSLHAYDLCSAYPHAMTSLPCLAHGKWHHTRGTDAQIRRVVDGSTAALVHCSSKDDAKNSWGALPWRSPIGEIVFPACNPGTWVWQKEFLAASAISNVRADECWYYQTKCTCKPFVKFAEYYKLRKEWGSQGKGLTLKNAINSGYGKLAQSRGQAPFNNWIWAGMITSATRALLLDAIARAKRPRDILMFATDGLISTSPIEFDVPETKDALGSWKHDDDGTYNEGVFLVRPGVYFPLGAHSIAKVRSRGVHRKMLMSNEQVIQEQFEQYGPQSIRIPNNVRFIGMLTGVYSTINGDIRQKRLYADWTDMSIDVSYDPAPKRSRVNKDLTLALVKTCPGESTPYDRAISEQLPESMARTFADLLMLENE